MVNKISSYLRQWRQPHILPVFYSLFLAFGELVALFSVLSSRSEGKRAFFLGYSLEKILLGTGLILLFLWFMMVIVKLIRRPDWSRYLWEKVFKNETMIAAVLWGAAIGFLVCWIALFLPYYRLGKLAEYVAQLKPVIIWLAVAGVVTILLVMFENGKESIRSIVLNNKTAVWMASIIFGLFVFAGVLVFYTGIGVRYPGDYWYGTGVPVLGLQILFSLLTGVFLSWFESKWKVKFTFKVDIQICLVLWLVTSWLWAQQPMLPNYFMPDTAGNIMYPYSDSATFDLNSQFALIGQGLFNSQFFDRSLYSAFLTYLHMVFGQNFEQLLTAQSIVYAVFPVIIYLLMKELHTRALGISAAVLILLRGVNSLISATWIDLASPKMILTDFPTAIGVALFVLFVIKWLKEPYKINFAVWAGGLIGLTLMLRTHVLLLVPFTIAYVLLAGIKIRLNYRIIASLALIIGMLTATTPWEIRNYSNGLPIFYMYYARIQLVLRGRYGINGDTYAPPRHLSVVSNNRLAYARNSSGGFMPEQTSTSAKMLEECSSYFCMITNQVFHNLITSVLFLPTSLEFDNLWNVIKEGPPFWRASWTGGGVGIPEGILISINLALISLGMGLLWERNKLIGLLPFVIYLTYILSNALALTSGGRYIVPVDWIICIYYFVGLFQITSWVFRRAGINPHFWADKVEDNITVPALYPVKYFNVFSALIIVFMIGSLVPVAEMPFERRYKVNTSEET
ncbi:MAG: hypothetical protein JNK26_05380, partial [Candidatus Doudnabacteria bacterium]|nr:hypothetical protein [Candidatus Doudnabacteria bacterium]